MNNALVTKAIKHIDGFNIVSHLKHICLFHSISCSYQLPGTFVDCGQHRADTCYECPQGHGSNWCNGECVWDPLNSECKKKGSQKC